MHLHGKGRKDRSVPLWKSTAATIRAWLHANPQLRGSAALLPNRAGHPMTRCNVAQRLALAVDRAVVEQPSLKTKRVSPHTLRHTTAMHLLQSGVPFNVIALWLGHETVSYTHLDVYKRQGLVRMAVSRLWRRQCTWARKLCIAAQGSDRRLPASLLMNCHLADCVYA